MNADITNALFELVGAFFTWKNFLVLKKERKLQGVYAPTTAFFTSWGIWNAFYYPTLNQWYSFWGAILLCSGNIAWVVLALRIKYRVSIEFRGVEWSCGPTFYRISNGVVFTHPVGDVTVSWNNVR